LELTDEGLALNWSKIESLLSECTKQSGASSVPGDIGLGSYGDVLKRYNGVEGFVGPTAYLMLWSVEQIPNLNIGYRVEDFAPGILLLGSDGGDTAYGIDRSTGKFGSVPFIGMSRADFKEMGATFEEFLTSLAGSQQA
jgi:hypothetical protein